MRIAIQQTALGDIPIEKCFAAAARSGVEGIGLCCRTADEVDGLGNAGRVSKLRTLAERSGMWISGLHLDALCEDASLIGPAGMIAQSQARIRIAMAAAVKLGRPDVVLPFFRRNRIELPKEFATAVEAVSELADFAKDLGVVLAVECSLHLEQLQQFLLSCESDYVKACLDTGEATACRHDAASMVHGLYTENIAQVHVKDVRVVRGLAPDFNVRLGRGDVPFQTVANALQSAGYDGWLVVETPPGDDHGAITAAHIDYTRKVFGLSPLPPVRRPPEEPCYNTQ